MEKHSQLTTELCSCLHELLGAYDNLAEELSELDGGEGTNIEKYQDTDLIAKCNCILRQVEVSKAKPV